MNSKDKDKFKADKFSCRVGARQGRCNAYCKPYGSGKVCGQWPMANGRCRRHGGRGNNGGWKTGNRKSIKEKSNIENPSETQCKQD